MTFINRVIVLKPEVFMRDIVQAELIVKRGWTLANFVQAWVNKMELIINSQES